MNRIYSKKALLVCLAAILTLSVVAFKSNGAEYVEGTIDTRFGKPGASVQLNYKVPKAINVNEAFIVELAFLSNEENGQLQIQLNSDQVVQINGKSSTVFELPNSSMKMNVGLTINAQGLYYLNVVTVKLSAEGDAEQGRSFAVPIQVGSSLKNLQKNKLQSIESDGRKIVEMIAE